jgi:hypothetical protein
LDVKLLQLDFHTHRHQTIWLCFRKGVRSVLILIAARRLALQSRPNLGTLYVPDIPVWEKGAKNLVQGLRYWVKELKDCEVYLDILQGLHPMFQSQIPET